MSDLLAGLTAERLAQIAAGERNVAGQLEAQADAEFPSWPDLAAALREDATHHRQLAAICEAVAGAERAMREPGGNELGFAMWAGEITVFFGPNDPYPFPTLLSALGAVGAEEKHDG